jgi:hypothetical protein
MPHTCDECGRDGWLHRHHEHHDPDVILMLCPACHMDLHRIRRHPGSVRFEATRGLTEREYRAVITLALIDGVDEFTIQHRHPLAKIVETVATLRVAAGYAA